MWYTATSASVTNGATVVAVTTGDDISNVRADSGLIFEGESPVQVKRGYIDGSGNKFIELESPWPYTAKTNQPLVAYPTSASFAEATAELRRVIDEFEIASTIEAQEGTDDKKAMSALKTKQAIDFNVASLNLLTAADAGLDSGETNYTSGNTNFNEFVFNQNETKNGIARNGSEVVIELPINSKVDPTSISATGTFYVVNSITSVTEATGVAPTIIGASSQRNLIVVLSSSGSFTKGDPYTVVAEAGGATIEANY